jgi:large subunit ribosomal protein L34e
MPNPNQKFKKKKTRKTPGGKSKTIIVKKKPNKHKCALCDSYLHGVPHCKRPFEVKKLKKTQRRPENLLASILCPICRQKVYQDAVMLKYKIKTKKDIDIKNIKYVEMIQNKIE